MSSTSLVTGLLPDGFERGPLQGQGLIGEITESIHTFLLDGWDADRPRPRIEEDLSFVPKDRQEVIYVYMYRVAQNTSLKNTKHWRPAKITLADPDPNRERVYYERPPIYLEVHYLIAVHARFRSDAERLLGWTMLRLWEANNLIYRPRRYTLPNGDVLDSTGAPWDLEADGAKVIMEKVGLALIDDLPIGDAINFFTIHDAPYRPFLTYRALCAMEGSLVAGPATGISAARMEQRETARSPRERPSGRLKQGDAPDKTQRPAIGPEGFDHRPLDEDGD